MKEVYSNEYDITEKLREADETGIRLADYYDSSNPTECVKDDINTRVREALNANSMNYLDQKGVREYRNCMGSGLIKVSGCSLYKLVRNLIVKYVGSTSAKDPVWKYKWVENHEPDVFRKINKWLDIGDYLTFLCS